jgi:hypothetical protein
MAGYKTDMRREVMEEKDNIIKKSISGPVKEIFTDIAELGLDEIIKIMAEEKEEIWMKNSSLDYSPLANTGLLTLPTGGMYAGNYGGAFINTLGSKFYELVVLEL